MVLRRHGRRRDATARLDEAGAVFAWLRSPLWLARAEAEARRLGGRRKASDALTPTEQRVAELAGQGLRNAEIAALLYVTPKTVEATLSRVSGSCACGHAPSSPGASPPPTRRAEQSHRHCPLPRRALTLYPSKR